jgi:hypothetical protein
MERANIHDRGCIERIYPRAVFEQEALSNTRGKASVLHGVRIYSAPDGSGAFDLARAAHQVGEDERSTNSVFLCPFAHQRTALDAGGRGGNADRLNALAGVRDDYDAFIDKIIATARRVRFDPAPGRGDPRLRGLRQ